MAPKLADGRGNTGGRGKSTSIDRVKALRESGMGSPEIRKDLKDDFATSRISQLLRDTRAPRADDGDHADNEPPERVPKPAARNASRKGARAKTDAAQGSASAPPAKRARVREPDVCALGGPSENPQAAASAPTLPKAIASKKQRVSAIEIGPGPKKRAAREDHSRHGPARAAAGVPDVVIVAGPPALPDPSVQQAAEARCLAHADSATKDLREYPIAGDGHCQFRAVAIQTADGEDSHLRLRERVALEVEANAHFYVRFFTSNRALRRWLRDLRSGAWGDNTSLQAIANILERPIITWRKDSEQAPTILTYRSYTEQAPLRPIYLVLDERFLGSEHYTARLQELPVDAAARIGDAHAGHDELFGCSSPPHSPLMKPRAARKNAPAQSPSKRKLSLLRRCRISGKQAPRKVVQSPKLARSAKAKRQGRYKLSDVETKVRDWSRAGSSQDQIVAKLLEEDGIKTSQQAISQLLKRPAGQRDLKHGAADAIAAGASQSAAAKKAGVSQPTLSRRLAAHGTRMTVGTSWQSEMNKAFAIGNEQPSLIEKLTPLEKKSQSKLDEQNWIAFGSWTFCDRCGRQRADGKLADWIRRTYLVGKLACVRCQGGCDRAAKDLDVDRDPDVEPLQRKAGETIKAYVTPQKSDWPAVFFELPVTELSKLAPIDLHVDYKNVKGGKAPTSNKKKLSVVRATWRRTKVEASLDTQPLRDAYAFLLANNATYKDYICKHNARIDNGELTGPTYIPTAQLLLHMPGIECAARPWLYPVASYGDTDIKNRLVSKGQLDKRQLPSIKTSFMRKILSRCTSYGSDFQLFSLVHDIALAKQLTSVVEMAKKNNIAPDQAASGMQNCQTFWVHERTQLEDMCRQLGKPNLFLTVAPAEWKFPWHRAMFARDKTTAEGLTDAQAKFTLHIYHVLQEVLAKTVLNKHPDEDMVRMTGIRSTQEYAMRIEFQSRGTLHVHIVAWVVFDEQGVDGGVRAKGVDKGP